MNCKIVLLDAFHVFLMCRRRAAVAAVLDEVESPHFSPQSACRRRNGDLDVHTLPSLADFHHTYASISRVPASSWQSGCQVIRSRFHKPGHARVAQSHARRDPGRQHAALFVRVAQPCVEFEESIAMQRWSGYSEVCKVGANYSKRFSFIPLVMTSD